MRGALQAAIWPRERDAEASWHLGRCRVPAGPRAEPPASWQGGQSCFDSVQFLCAASVITPPASSTAEAQTRAPGTVFTGRPAWGLVGKGWAKKLAVPSLQTCGDQYGSRQSRAVIKHVKRSWSKLGCAVSDKHAGPTGLSM